MKVGEVVLIRFPKLPAWCRYVYRTLPIMVAPLVSVTPCDALNTGLWLVQLWRALWGYVHSTLWGGYETSQSTTFSLDVSVHASRLRAHWTWARACTSEFGTVPYAPDYCQAWVWGKSPNSDSALYVAGRVAPVPYWAQRVTQLLDDCSDTVTDTELQKLSTGVPHRN